MILIKNLQIIALIKLKKYEIYANILALLYVNSIIWRNYTFLFYYQLINIIKNTFII